MNEIPDRIRIKVVSNGYECDMVRVRKPYTAEAKHFRADGGSEGRPYFSEEEVRNNIKSGCWSWIDKPFEIPASPFYVRGAGGTEFRIEVRGLHYTATDIKTGKSYGPDDSHMTRQIPAAFSGGWWTLIDPPAPAVDPVVAATAEVQRLLREQADAKAECDAAQDVLDKAEEKRRNIGKALTEAQRALDKANHDAAGVQFGDRPTATQLIARGRRNHEWRIG
ncbi:hypothetical protein [Bradyrhizobium yuanmingense]|uniref:hypothetical protein n=1 Tax=Bradyrhizobium yuanmingense TaxID=108015 RepID=UPI0004B4C710|nr:hypothetical protein [Bradyrhizobium yuanmingense]